LRSPSQRTRHMNMNVAGTVNAHRPNRERNREGSL
jgi:hypothetical protein